MPTVAAAAAVQSLLIQQNPTAKQSRNRIRSYNCSFQRASSTFNGGPDAQQGVHNITMHNVDTKYDAARVCRFCYALLGCLPLLLLARQAVIDHATNPFMQAVSA